jgi:beta-glucosidase
MFPSDFIWGVASSAYQIEGRAPKDGCGDTVWDSFCKDGRIYQGQDARTACDHIHQYPEDFALMRNLGIKHYRFSVNWARILPKGTGDVNPEGIAYYQDLLREMHRNGITPYLTLFHWEFPQALEDQGGWENPDSVAWFGEYARVIATHFGSLCRHFITLNEPQCFVGLGYLKGEHAPGKKLSPASIIRIIHNVLLAHGTAVDMLRQYAGQPLQVGYAPTCGVALPATDAPEDIEAAREAYFSIPTNLDNFTWNVSWFSDPVLLGHYPEEIFDLYKEWIPADLLEQMRSDEDLALISRPLDFLCQNIYNGYPVRAGAEGGYETLARYPGFPRTGTGWPITPEALYWGSRFLYTRYRMPLYISENGVSCLDRIGADGRVHDPDRIDFLERYLYRLRQAVGDGVDIRGYFLWTFLDNFEWSEGYSQRFGIVYVDFPTGRRLVKDSAYWYRRMIQTNGETLFWNQDKLRTVFPGQMLLWKPILKEYIWGGRRLLTEFAYQAEGDHVGECWAISAHPHGDCELIEERYRESAFINGKPSPKPVGTTLSRLYADHREMFGHLTNTVFPLLIKLIDAKEDLSIQVHPDDAYAASHEGGSMGKSECWYILDCPQDAFLLLGHHAQTREELADMIARERYDDLLCKVPIQKGDFVTILPGTIHAITAGCLLLEIQQNSDLTYRLYDYNRLQNGVPRPLHTAKCLDVIRVPDGVGENRVTSTRNLSPNQMHVLGACPQYLVYKLIVRGEFAAEQSHPFLILSVIEGDGVIDGRPVRKGTHMLLPYGYGTVHFLGEMEIILSTLPPSDDITG